MRKSLFSFGVLFILHSAAAQTFYANSGTYAPITNQTLQLNVSNCNISTIPTCPPTNDTVEAFQDEYSDMAIDAAGNVYYVSAWGSLYQRNLITNSVCRFLGSFGFDINALVTDINGVVYGAGNQNGVGSLYKYEPKTGVFTTIGTFPTGIYSSGDLFFYEGRLFMTGTTSDLSSSYIEEVNIGNPMLSCFYMDLGNLMPFGAFSINSGGSSQAYIISTVFVSNNIYSSTLMEVNMSARTIGPVLCTYPFSITGAASVYTYTPLPVTPPSVSISLAQGDTCNSKYLTFTSSVLQGGPSPNYQWTRNGVNVGANSANYTDSVVYNGDSIQCTVTSGDDCSIAAVGASNIIIVNLNSLLVPAVTIRASADSICQADSIVFTASAINGGLQPGFQWRKNGVPVGSDTSSYTDYKLLNGDLISCTMTSNAGKCLAFSSASSAPLAITVFADPVVPLSHAIALCKGEVRQLDAGDFSSFLWSDGSTGRTLVVADTGTYYVTVTDKNGCKGSDTIAIVISTNGCLAGFFIPSGFTPNNDGKNDIFKPTILGRMTKYQFTIYDRWGMMVFQTADINQGWDGTVSGKPQSANTFAWSCSYQIEGEPARVQRGTVLLIR